MLYEVITPIPHSVKPLFLLTYDGFQFITGKAELQLFETAVRGLGSRLQPFQPLALAEFTQVEVLLQAVRTHQQSRRRATERGVHLLDRHLAQVGIVHPDFLAIADEQLAVVV